MDRRAQSVALVVVSLLLVGAGASAATIPPVGYDTRGSASTADVDDAPTPTGPPDAKSPPSHAIIADAEGAPNISLRIGSTSETNDGTTPVWFDIENTGDATIDSLMLNVTGYTDGLTPINATSSNATSIPTNDTLRFGSIAPGEKIEARVTFAVNGSRTGIQTVTARATATGGNASVTRTGSTRILVAHFPRFRNVTLTPTEVAENGTVTQRLTFTAINVSDDGEPDTIVIRFGPPVQHINLDEASIRAADGELIPITNVEQEESTLVKIDVSPNSPAPHRTLSGNLLINATVPPVEANTTVEVVMAVTASFSRSDTTAVEFTIRDDGPQAPRVGESTTPARDPDDDGLYEDVNGDGTVTPGDATVLFDAVFERDAAVTENRGLFDFNGDEQVTPGDATVLFTESF